MRLKFYFVTDNENACSTVSIPFDSSVSSTDSPYAEVKGELDGVGLAPLHGSGAIDNSRDSIVGYVYLLKAGPFYKIGKSRNPDERIRRIKLQLPYPVEVVHVMASHDMTALETEWHKRFRDKQTNGEWFLLSERDVERFVND